MPTAAQRAASEVVMVRPSWTWTAAACVACGGAPARSVVIASSPHAEARTAANRIESSACPAPALPATLEISRRQVPADAATRAQIRELKAAEALFVEFIARAGDDAEYAATVSESRLRIDDIERTIEFLEAGLSAVVPPN